MPRLIASPRRLFLIVGVCASLGLAACGGSSSKSTTSTGAGSAATYATQAKQVGQTFQSEAQIAAQQESQATSAAAKITALHGLEAAVVKAANSFAALNPPANAKSLNADLVGELRNLSIDVRNVEDALRTTNVTKARQAIAGVQATQMKVGSTLQQLQVAIGQ